MKRKFLAMLLVMMMVLSMMPMAAFAAGGNSGSAYYTITYVDGVSGDLLGKEELQYGDVYTFIDQIPKNGTLPFLYWSRETGEGYTERIAAGDRYELLEDVTLSAYYGSADLTSYKVTYESEPGVVFDYYYTASDQAIVEPYREPTRAGDTFIGWDISELGSNGVFTANRDVVVRAVWESDTVAKGYDVTYEDSISGTSYGSNYILVGDSYVFPDVIPNHEGYTFVGWFTKKTGGVQVTTDDIFDASSDITVYAQFTKDAEIVTPPSVSAVSIELTIDSPIIKVNAKSSLIDDMGTKPVIRNSRTLLPVRAVVEAMGGTVGWQADTRVVTMTIGDQTMMMQIDNATVWDNKGQTFKIDTAPVIINSRTMLPIRFVAEYFGATVGWDPVKRVVSIDYEGEDNPGSDAKG